MSQGKMQETQQKLHMLEQNRFGFFEMEKEATQAHPCRYGAVWNLSTFLIFPWTDPSHPVPFHMRNLFACWQPELRARVLNQDMSGPNSALLVPTTAVIPGFLGLQQSSRITNWNPLSILYLYGKGPEEIRPVLICIIINLHSTSHRPAPHFCSGQIFL